jgi:putative transposase
MLFFIEHGTRRAHLAGITTHPSGEWVIQQARNLLMNLEDQADELKFLVRDRDAKFTAAFQRGIHRHRRGDRQDAGAGAPSERDRLKVDRHARRECLDRMLITGEGHLRLVLGEYIDQLQPASPAMRGALTFAVRDMNRVGMTATQLDGS